MPKEVKPRAAKVEKAEKVTKTKKAKDPDAPKRPLSAYMFFSQDQRATVKEDNPDATFGDLGKLLGAKWKEMSDSEKKPYTAKAEADKVRYESAKAGYEKKED